MPSIRNRLFPAPEIPEALQQKIDAAIDEHVEPWDGMMVHLCSLKRPIWIGSDAAEAGKDGETPEDALREILLEITHKVASLALAEPVPDRFQRLEIDWIMREVMNGRGAHGDFLRSLAECWCRADEINQSYLQASAERLIEKYRLEEYLSNFPAVRSTEARP